jgi:DNA primase
VVTIAEGVFGALALERAGAPNPTAILGSYLTPEKFNLLKRFETILVATDPDDAGEKVTKSLGTLGRRARVIRLGMSRSPDDCTPEELRDVVRCAFDPPVDKLISS